MATLCLLRPGQSIRMLLHREPFPLYPLLAERGYGHATHMETDGSYVILIHKETSTSTAMSLQAGLAFEQAPPFILPLRFFLTAPLFLLAAAGMIVFAPESLASRWTPQALALTHALTLGFLAMVMLGALSQMLPVVAGSPLPAPRLVAWLSHVPLALGTVSLMTGFCGRTQPHSASASPCWAAASWFFSRPQPSA